MSKINYTIIYTNTNTLGDISWLGSTWETEEIAYEIGTKVCEELRDSIPSIDFMILAHTHEWITKINDNEL